MSCAPLEPDDFSLAFAMLALLLTCGLLAGIVLVVWVLGAR